jgi:hypothetical protein
MNEKDWLTSTDPHAMLACLRGTNVHTEEFRLETKNPALTDRKLRLFAVARCRQVWDGTPCPRCHGNKTIRQRTYEQGNLREYRQCPDCRGTGTVGGLNDPRSRRAVEVAESFADGEATERQMVHWRRVYDDSNSSEPADWGWLLVHDAVRDNLHYIRESIQNTYRFVPSTTQAALLRCIFGNPFRKIFLWPGEVARKLRPDILQEPVVPYVHSNILRWNDGIIPRIAQAIYEERAFHDIGVLGDALEEAGCTDAAMLEHCHLESVHARGCWVVDEILGVNRYRKVSSKL